MLKAVPSWLFQATKKPLATFTDSASSGQITVTLGISSRSSPSSSPDSPWVMESSCWG